jgi:ribosomal protein S25
MLRELDDMGGSDDKSNLSKAFDAAKRDYKLAREKMKEHGGLAKGSYEMMTILDKVDKTLSKINKEIVDIKTNGPRAISRDLKDEMSKVEEIINKYEDIQTDLFLAGDPEFEYREFSTIVREHKVASLDIPTLEKSLKSAKDLENKINKTLDMLATGEDVSGIQGILTKYIALVKKMQSLILRAMDI